MLFGLTYYLPEAVLTVGDNLEFLIRILVVELFGFLIGLERSKRQKDAGIRTHCIIAVTSAVIMILSKYCFVDLVDLGIAGRNSDPGRMATQVVSGISFLGAGVILTGTPRQSRASPRPQACGRLLLSFPRGQRRPCGAGAQRPHRGYTRNAEIHPSVRQKPRRPHRMQ